MRRTGLAVSLVFLFIVAGCIGFTEPGDEVEISFSGDLNVSETGFQMEGTVSEGGGTGGAGVYQDVVVCLFDRDGRLLSRTSPEDLGPSEKWLDVFLETSDVPAYIVVNSTDFWGHGAEIEVAYYERTSTDDTAQYRVNYVTDRQSLPVRGCS